MLRLRKRHGDTLGGKPVRRLRGAPSRAPHAWRQTATPRIKAQTDISSANGSGPKSAPHPEAAPPSGVRKSIPGVPSPAFAISDPAKSDTCRFYTPLNDRRSARLHNACTSSRGKGAWPATVAAAGSDRAGVLVGAGEAPQLHPSGGGRPWNTETTGDVGPTRRQVRGNPDIRDQASRPGPPVGGFKGEQARTASGRHASG